MNASYQGPPLKLSSEGATSTIRQLSDMSSDDVWRTAPGEQAQPDLPSFAGRWDVRVPAPVASSSACNVHMLFRSRNVQGVRVGARSYRDYSSDLASTCDVQACSFPPATLPTSAVCQRWPDE